jgi:hypothetical protein
MDTRQRAQPVAEHLRMATEGRGGVDVNRGADFGGDPGYGDVLHMEFAVLKMKMVHQRGGKSNSSERRSCD